MSFIQKGKSSVEPSKARATRVPRHQELAIVPRNYLIVERGDDYPSTYRGLSLFRRTIFSTISEHIFRCLPSGCVEALLRRKSSFTAWPPGGTSIIPVSGLTS